MLLTPEKFLESVSPTLTKEEILAAIDNLISKKLDYDLARKSGLDYYVYATKLGEDGEITYGIDANFPSTVARNADIRHVEAFKILNYLAH